tara:strand:+ start:28767 stop:28892 length:126 start_codon:yes stop_codon:yes gene_type:complete
MTKLKTTPSAPQKKETRAPLRQKPQTAIGGKAALYPTRQKN